MEQSNIFETQKETSLLKKFSEIHNSIYANDGLSAQQALDEMLKVLFIKVFDEKENTKQFFINNEEFNDIKAGKKTKTFVQRIESLFQKTVQGFSDIFDANETIKLSPIALSFAINKLQNVDFSDTTDAKGLAFQKFLASTEKADRGQFFTPEPVINFCVEFLQPQPHEKIIDPTCGSGGFLFSAYQYLLDNFQVSKQDIIPNLFGIDINKTIVKIAKMKLLLECNTNLNIIAQNSLEDLDELALSFGQPIENQMDIVLANPPFGTLGKITNEKLLRKYELGYKWQGENYNYHKTKTLHTGQTPEILFIERCLQLLKEGGRMAIVLPNGMFENPSLEYLRIFIKQKARVLAVVNLPQETFIPFGTGVKTSILFLQKESEIDLSKKVFFGRITKLGYQGNKNGNPIYQKDEFGNFLKNENKELILEEDFTKIINDYKTFQKTNELETENSFLFPVSELNGRFDFDYYAPQNRKLLNKLKNLNAVRLSELCEIVKVKSKKLTQLNETVDYIELSDINTHSYEIINANTYLVHELPSRASYEVRNNDILTAVAGNSIGTHKHATALVTKNYEGNICTNGFRILRNCKVDVYYLLYYLRSEMFLKQVFMYRTGAAIPNISDFDLNRILVYLPPENILQEVSEKVRYSFELRKQAKEEVEKIMVEF
ncbi:MAG: methyltransferase domain-containing protein [Bacteroidetes bacterium]|nr:MAG: methyltransferase domain-containing protein [Bacteroidota bacterium]